MEKLYLRFTWLSLDVVLGAMAGMLFFARLLRVDIFWQAYVLLGMAVWCIYTADHLMDSRKLSGASSEDRHKFHHNHFRILIAALFAVGGIGLYGAIAHFGFTLELLLGAGLGVLILAIMLMVRKFVSKNVWLKELSSAVFYVVGIAWLPWYQVATVDRNWTAMVLTAVYVGLAYLNLIMLSNLDAEKDRAYGFNSISNLLSPEKHLVLIRQLAILLISCCAGLLFYMNSLQRIFPALLLIMLLVHYLSFFNSGQNPGQIRMRMEIAFVIPLLLLLF